MGIVRWTGQFMYRRDSPSRARSVFSFVEQQDGTAADDAGKWRLKTPVPRHLSV